MATKLVVDGVKDKQVTINVLFVDDNTLVLDGLARALRKHRGEWRMAFASSANCALDELSKSRYDVVITDVRMPETDGVEFLRTVRDRHPETIRIVLSGHSDFAASNKLAYLAHQYLAKPCDATDIYEIVNRVCHLPTSKLKEDWRKIVVNLTQLPARPSIHQKLNCLLQQADVSLREVADVVEQDPALCAKILQLVNSAFFGLPQGITKIDRAVFYLGVDVLRCLVLSLETFQGLQELGEGFAFNYDAFQVHSFLSGRLAKRIANDPKLQDQAFVAGMLHDIGSVVLATQWRKLGVNAQEFDGRPVIGSLKNETERLGVNHAELGAYLIGLWGLPQPVVEAVAFHHNPSEYQPNTFGLVGVTHVASALVSANGHGSQPSFECETPMDLAYLDACGVRDCLPVWTEMAKEEMSRQ